MTFLNIIQDKQAVRQTIHEYNPDYYKCTGSVVAWALHNKLHAAFTVWMLVQRYDRQKHNGLPTGIITTPFLIDRLSKDMSVKQKTAKKYLGEALRYGFLDYLLDGYTITGHRRMIEVAMDDQSRRYEDAKFEGVNKPIGPIDLLAADREYTRTFNNWIAMGNMAQTKALMASCVMQQGTILARGRKRQGNITGCCSRTMIRRTKAANITATARYVRMDPLKMLVDASCTSREAIKAMVLAEKEYIKQGYGTPGHKVLHEKYIMSHCKSALVAQVANCYTSKLDVKEVPAIHTSRRWMRKSSDSFPRRPIEQDRNALRQAPRSYTTWKTDKFVKSGNWDDTHIPENVIGSVAHYLREIVTNQGCADLIMSHTGATNIRSVYAAEPRGWKVRVSGVIPLEIGNHSDKTFSLGR